MSIRSKALDLFGDLVLPIAVVFFVLFLIMVIPACYFDYKKHKRLLQQCIDDGNKEYVCEAMFKRCSGGGGGGIVHQPPLGHP